MFYVLCALLFLIINAISFVLTVITFCLVFRSELNLALDNVYGKQTENGSWDGIMGMMARGEVDATSVELTMEPMRSEAVDYIAPLINYRFVCLFVCLYVILL
jgi:hypothetical protein